MGGYIVALVTLVACLVYIQISRKSSRKSEKIIHAIPDMVFILNRSLEILKLYNPDREKLLVLPEQIIGTNLKQYFPEKYICQFEKAIATTLETDQTCEIEYSLEINSNILYFEARYLKIDDYTVTCVIRDITNRKNSAIALQQNQELLNAMMDNIPFPVMLKDVKDNFRYLYWNNECNKQSGYNRNEILGKTDIDLYGEERGGKYQEIDKKLVQNGEFYRNQEEFLTPDGVVHHTIVTKNIIKNDIYTWLLVTRWDISDLIQTQQALKEINQLNQLILDNSNAGYIFINSNYKVEWENISKYFSSPIAKAYQKGVTCYKNVKGLEHPCPNCIMQKTFKSQKIERQENIYNHITAEITSTPIFNESGDIKGIVLKIEDVTLKKEAEKELREAKENAEKSDHLKSAFLANMSHEIRTPLNAIVGFSELLCNTEEEQEKQKYIQIIRKNNESLLQLISDILDISKIEANTFEFFFETIDINQMLDEFNKTILSKVLPENSLSIQFKPGLSDCLIYSDKERLMQVLFYLVNNAIKFTEKGKIVIGYELRNDELCFYVKDTGIGIPQEKQEIIFERFVKLDNFKDGTGLGLAIAQTIIQKLKGNIGVTSKPGEGSTFWFTIPYISKQ